MISSKQAAGRKPDSSKRVNLKVSLPDELYVQIKEYKARHKISISALVRDFMKSEIEKFEALEKKAL